METFVKRAIARLFVAIIHADGNVSSIELEYLEKRLVPKYNLLQIDFDKTLEVTFAQAVNTIISEDGISYLSKKNMSLLSIEKDMEELAKCDNDIHFKEALLCLAFRLAKEKGICSVVSFDNNHLKFSKQEIIYIESTEDESINRDILENYEVICYMMQCFGFRFVYIPKIVDTFLEYSDEYKEYLMKHRRHNTKIYNASNKTVLDFNNHVLKATTSIFAQMLMSKMTQKEIVPSLLIKLSSTQMRNPDSQTDFLLLHINKGGVLSSLQSFLTKYDNLCGKYNLLIERGVSSNVFYSKSFQGTFFEFLINMTEDNEIHIFNNRISICFGIESSIEMGRSAKAALYLTELLFSNCSGSECDSFVNDWQYEDQMKKQFDCFKTIYKYLTGDDYHYQGEKNTWHICDTIEKIEINDSDFYRLKLAKINDQIIRSFEKTFEDDSYVIKRYCPYYDKQGKKIKLPKVIYTVIIHNNTEEECFLLNDWVYSLQKP